jgi:HD superfamily phosphodiesterase
MICRDTFDLHLKGILDSPKSSQSMKTLWAKYQLAKSTLPSEILSWIPKTDGNLSEHGILHIDNVFENTARLLSLSPEVGVDGHLEGKPFCGLEIKPVDAFVLGMALFFHDTGNIISRKGHAKTGREVMYEVLKDVLKIDEIRVIDQVMSAHSGTTANGDPDKIKALDDAPRYICKESVRMRPLAALVRFADDLAEGPQRTSNYLRSKGAFIIPKLAGQPSDDKEERNIFHDYASITAVNIDRGNGRIALQYNIDLEDNMFDPQKGAGKEFLEPLLKLVFYRIKKTDDERRYARFYGGKLLTDFHTTEALIQFYRNGSDIETGLGPLVLNDLVVPPHSDDMNKSTEWIKNQDPAYDIKNLLEKVWK